MLQTKRTAPEDDAFGHDRGKQHQRPAAVAAQRKKRHRGELVAQAVEVLVKLEVQDETISSATLIFPNGEVQFLALDPFNRGGIA